MATFRPQSWASQDGFSYRFDWGVTGLAAVAPTCGAIVVVDVLRFSTAASLVVELGGSIELSDDPADLRLGLSGLRRQLTDDPATPIRLWSPNGGVTAATAIGLANTSSPASSEPTSAWPASSNVAVFAGCLRNAATTAAAALAAADGRPIAVIAAGEQWNDGRLRPATEDLLGAGAVLARLDPAGSLTEPCCSPAARSARAAFVDAEPLLLDLVSATASGRQLWERGDGDDVREAARLDIATVPCRLR